MSRIPKEFWSTFTEGVKNVEGRDSRSIVDLTHISQVRCLPMGKIEVLRVDGLA